MLAVALPGVNEVAGAWGMVGENLHFTLLPLGKTFSSGLNSAIACFRQLTLRVV
jgi:hypothetical protein